MVSIAPVRLTRPGSLAVVRRLRRLWLPALAGVAAALGLVLGGLTSFAQAVLPDALGPAANSSSSWTLLVVLIVLLLRPRPVRAAVLGVVGFAALTLGYQIVSTLRGYPTAEVFFLLASLVVGPFVGVAAAWLRERGWRPALAAALLGGVGIGEGVYGLTALAAATAPLWWVAVAGAALVAAVVARRATAWWQRLLAPAGALLVAALFLLAYAAQ